MTPAPPPTSRRPCVPAKPAAAAAATILLALAAAAPAETYTNPVVPRGGDPWGTQWQGQYFYTSTTGGDVRIARSPWLQNLNSNSRTVWNPPAGTPYGSEIWAPELHRLNGKWYIYVAADDGTDANHRMYVLEGDSQDPQGSYTLRGQISIPDNRWAIDGTVLELGAKDYFIWSGRRFSSGGNDSGADQSLYIAEMTNPWTLTGSRVAISNPTLSWERYGHPVNEGPEILKHGNDVFLTYSASGFYTPQYAIGALKLTAGANPLLASSWTKLPQPLFDQGNGVEGTGHASFVKSPDGTQDWIVYHARTSNDAPRDVRIQPFTWGADRVPQFGDPIPTGQATPAPSGVPLVTFIPNLSFERGGTGWLDDFFVTGDAGATPNDGSHFSPIAGADGPCVGYLGAGPGNAIHQDIGPLHAGTYTLSLGLALSSDQAAAAASDPATFLLRIEAVGLFPGGAADEADQTLLAETSIDSASLNPLSFSYFNASALVPDGALVGSWLRVELVSAGGPAAAWQVKLDSMTLDFGATPGIGVPEPSAAAATALTCLCTSLARRRRRRTCPAARRHLRKSAGEIRNLPLDTRNPTEQTAYNPPRHQPAGLPRASSRRPAGML